MLSVSSTTIDLKWALGESSSNDLELKNTSTQTVAFKVRTNLPKLFAVKPVQALLAPGDSCRVKLMLKPLKSLELENPPKFLVMACPTDGSVETEDLFVTNKAKIENTKITCKIVEPSEDAGAEEDAKQAAASAEEAKQAEAAKAAAAAEAEATAKEAKEAAAAAEEAREAEVAAEAEEWTVSPPTSEEEEEEDTETETECKTSWTQYEGIHCPNGPLQQAGARADGESGGGSGVEVAKAEGRVAGRVASPSVEALAEGAGSAGAAVASAALSGDLALFAAIRAGDLAAMALAVEGGACVSAATNIEGDSPMVVAAESGHVAAMAWLEEQGADVNAANHNGATALHYAARGGHVAAMQWLLEHGADVSVDEDDGSMAFYWGEIKKIIHTVGAAAAGWRLAGL